MTIDESIEHCEQIAEEQGCTECGYNHRQLADWLRELKEFKSSADLVVHGHWNTVDDGDGDTHYKCSICGEEWFILDGTSLENNMNYCPKCGGRMDGEKE